VEIKNEQKTEPLGEFLLSDVVYGYKQAFLRAKDTLTFPEILKFFEQMTQQEECTGRYSCVERMIKRVMATPNSPLNYA